jgi:MerR family mercuric resistance operon transcriptional regulator
MPPLPGSGSLDCDVEGNARAMPALAPATIAGLARASGIAVASIRFYERLGLLPKPRRSVGGRASYHREHLERLVFIARALKLGFSLEAVGELLGLHGGLRTCSDINKVGQRHLAEVRRRLAELARIERALAPLVEACPRSGGPNDCPLIIALARPA